MELNERWRDDVININIGFAMNIQSSNLCISRVKCASLSLTVNSILKLCWKYFVFSSELTFWVEFLNILNDQKRIWKVIKGWKCDWDVRIMEKWIKWISRNTNDERQKTMGFASPTNLSSAKVRWLTNASKFCEKFDFWKVFIQNHNRQIQHSVSIHSLLYLTSRRLCMTRIQTVSKRFQITEVDFWVLLLFEQNFSNQRVLGIISDLVISSKLFEIFE